MSLSLISTQHWDTVTALFTDSQSDIRIISPFINDRPAEHLCDALQRNPNVSCKIITRFYREDFIQGVSSVKAIKNLIESGAEIYALLNLHTKLYLFDGNTALIGSANFTTGGFNFNHELSLLIEGETELFDELNGYFGSLLSQINQSGDYKISLSKAEEEIEAVKQQRQNRRQRGVTHQPNEKKFGATVNQSHTPDSSNSRPNIDPIQEIVSYRPIDAIDEGIWLKFEGKSSNRFDKYQKYNPIRHISSESIITCFPQNPSGIKNGAYIYMAILTTDHKGRNTPVVMGRGRTLGFEPINKATDSMMRQYPWMHDYPFYINMYNFEYLKCDCRDGISLIDILAEVGASTYPNSRGTSKSLTDLSIVHHRQSHLRITEECKAYIDKEFEQLRKKYGSEIIE